MWLLHVFTLALAFWRAVGDTDCLVETLKCSRLRPNFPTHKGLITRHEMGQVCRQQNWFFRCLDNLVDAEVTCEESIPHLQRARALFKDFCSDNSSWQQKYYEMAPCINRQHTEACTTPKFLVRGHRNKDICFLREKALNCIAVTLVASCGREAAELFYHLLRMTTDHDDCNMVGSEILFLPALQEHGDDKATCNEAFTNLVSSIVKVPELEASMDYSVSVAADNDIISYPNDSMTDYLADFLPVTSDYGKTSEFDASYKPSRQGIFDVRSPEKLNKYNGTSYRKPQKAIRFHGNNSLSTYQRYFVYSRHVEFDFCENKYEDGKKVLVCIYVERKEDPICLEGGRNRNLTGINPEDVDPELGARLYAMFPYAYYFRPYEEMQERMLKHVHETNKNVFNRIREYMSAPESPQTTDESVRVTDFVTEKVGDLHTKLDEEFIKDSPVFYASDSSDPESLNKDITIWDLLEKYANASEFRRQSKSLDTSKPVIPPNISPGKSNDDTSNLSKEQDTLLRLVAEENAWQMENMTNLADIQSDFVSPTATRIKSLIAKEDSLLVNMTCGRVNECHPNATDIFRCLYYFSLDDKEPLEEEPVDKEPQARRRRPRELATDVKLKSNVKELNLQTNERPGRMENLEPIIFDESYKNLLQIPVMEVETEHANVFVDALPGVLPDTEAIEFMLLEPDALPLLDSEASHKIKRDESINDELNKAEDVDRTQEENPKQISLTELLKKMGDQEPSDDLLLDDLFALIALENMRDEL